MAFLDICPVNPGHTLVIPRRHVVALEELSAEEIQRMMVICQRIVSAQRHSLNCEANTIHLANGEAAGQEVPHAHFHVIPRRSGDGFGLRLPAGYGGPENREELESVALGLREALSVIRQSPPLGEKSR